MSEQPVITQPSPSPQVSPEIPVPLPGIPWGGISFLLVGGGAVFGWLISVLTKGRSFTKAIAKGEKMAQTVQELPTTLEKIDESIQKLRSDSLSSQESYQEKVSQLTNLILTLQRGLNRLEESQSEAIDEVKDEMKKSKNEIEDLSRKLSKNQAELGDVALLIEKLRPYFWRVTEFLLRYHPEAFRRDADFQAFAFATGRTTENIIEMRQKFLREKTEDRTAKVEAIESRLLPVLEEGIEEKSAHSKT